ncbi:hypothetical protein B0H13DRAFT_1866306 [Mycena leptocephala]|nr:hypothetical protein B0H13DRAFT_1866306 [Mycena leptocephala]
MDQKPFDIQVHPIRLTNNLMVTALEHSSFNWLAKDNNQVATWTRYVQSLFHQTVVNFRLNEALLTADPSLLLFHKQAFDIIRAQPGLADFPCWANVPAINDSELTVPSFDDSKMLATTQALKRAELQTKFTACMACYIASLAKQGSLGIPLKCMSTDSEDEDEDDDDKKPVFGLFPRLKSTLYQFWKATAIKTDATNHKFSTADDVDMEVDVNALTSEDWESMLGFHVEWATEQDVEHYLHKRKRHEEEEEEEEPSSKRIRSAGPITTPPPPPGNQLGLAMAKDL